MLFDNNTAVKFKFVVADKKISYNNRRNFPVFGQAIRMKTKISVT